MKLEKKMIGSGGRANKHLSGTGNYINAARNHKNTRIILKNEGNKFYRLRRVLLNKNLNISRYSKRSVSHTITQPIAQQKQTH